MADGRESTASRVGEMQSECGGGEMGVRGAVESEAEGRRSREKRTRKRGGEGGERRHGRPRRGCFGAYTRHRSMPPLPESNL